MKGNKKGNKKKFDKVDIQHSENKVVNIKKSMDKNTAIIPGYSKESYYTEYTCSHVKSNKCWNCSYSIDNIHVSIPLKYNEGIFYIYGNFCSYECGGRYILEHYADKNMWDMYSLLDLYYNISSNSIGHKVTPAPNKLLLDVFGGSMSIEDYRSKFNTSNIYDVYQPPIVPIKCSSVLLENNSSSENKHNFKLYRKKPINSSNNIYNTMNLTTNDNETASDIMD